MTSGKILQDIFLSPVYSFRYRYNSCFCAEMLCVVLKLISGFCLKPNVIKNFDFVREFAPLPLMIK